MASTSHRKSAVPSIWSTDTLTDAPTPFFQQIFDLRDLADPAKTAAALHAVDWSFTNDSSGYLGHNIHPYPAKFIPQIPANLIAALSLRGELVWDPFGGSGTTALEALLMGRRALSTDANPLASLICRVKTTALLPEERRSLQALHEELAAICQGDAPDVTIDKLWPRTKHHTPAIPNLDRWFELVAVKTLCYLKDEVLALASVRAREFALVVFSAIILRVSNQDSETRYARRVRNADAGEIVGIYCRALRNAINSHEPLERLLGYRTATVAVAEMGAHDEGLAALVPDESVDLVVTSPPYANATDYHLYHRFRLFWLGFNPAELATREIGSHLRHQRLKAGFELYRNEMASCLTKISRALRPARYAAVVIGDSVFEGAVVRTASELAELATSQGLEVIATITRTLHQTKRSFIPAARRTRTEDILLLRKPPRNLRLVYCGTSYNMFPYEKRLQEYEIASVIGKQIERVDGRVASTLHCLDVDRLQRLSFTHRIQGANQHSKPEWVTWQSVVENGDSLAGRKNPKYLTHGIHPYKGKFYPQLAKALLNIAGVPHGGRVLDPFCGSGTVLLEAQLNGIDAIGLDMNPLAVEISKAKTSVLGENEILLDRALKNFADGLGGYSHDAAHVDLFKGETAGEISRWFAEPVAAKLGWILLRIRRMPEEKTRRLLEVLLSSVIREVSHQDPADLRIRRRKKLLSDAPVIELFLERIKYFRERLWRFAKARPWAPWQFGAAQVHLADSRDPLTLERLYSDPVDCVVTSPPYATALPYIDTDRLSLLVLLGLATPERSRLERDLTGSREIRPVERRLLEDMIQNSDIEEQIGSASGARLVRNVLRNNKSEPAGFRRQNMASLLLRYFQGMAATMENAGRATRLGGHLFFVIGDNKTTAGKTTLAIRSSVYLREMGLSLGWDLEREIPITVTREAGLHSRNSITANVILHFRKIKA